MTRLDGGAVAWAYDVAGGGARESPNHETRARELFAQLHHVRLPRQCAVNMKAPVSLYC